MSVKKYGIEDHSDQPVTNVGKKLLIPRQFADQVTVLVAEDSSVEYASKIDMVWTFGKLSKIRIGGAHHVSFSYLLEIKIPCLLQDNISIFFQVWTTAIVQYAEIEIAKERLDH